MKKREKQIIAIDEAGDTGFKKGSSRYFVVACVVFDNESEAALASAIIENQIQRLGWYGKAEFKFHQTQKKHILDLFKRLKDVKYSVVATIIDKTTLDGSVKPNTFYNESIRDTLLLCEPWEAKVRLDGRHEQNYTRNAVAHFRKSVNQDKDKRKVIHFRFVDSTDNTLVQLADLVAGSVLRSTNKSKTDSQDYLRALKSKIKLINTIK